MLSVTESFLGKHAVCTRRMVKGEKKERELEIIVRVREQRVGVGARQNEGADKEPCFLLALT